MSKELRAEYERETNSMAYYCFKNRHSLTEVRHTKSYVEWLEQQNTELKAENESLCKDLVYFVHDTEKKDKTINELKAEVERLKGVVKKAIGLTKDVPYVYYEDLLKTLQPTKTDK